MRVNGSEHAEIGDDILFPDKAATTAADWGIRVIFHANQLRDRTGWIRVEELERLSPAIRARR